MSLFPETDGLHTSRPGLVQRYVSQLKAAGRDFYQVLGSLQNDRKARTAEVRDIASGLGSDGKEHRREEIIDRVARAAAQPGNEYGPDIRYQLYLERRTAMGLPEQGFTPDPCRDTVVRIQDFQRGKGPKR